MSFVASCQIDRVNVHTISPENVPHPDMTTLSLGYDLLLEDTFKSGLIRIIEGAEPSGLLVSTPMIHMYAQHFAGRFRFLNHRENSVKLSD